MIGKLVKSCERAPVVPVDHADSIVMPTRKTYFAALFCTSIEIVQPDSWDKGSILAVAFQGVDSGNERSYSSLGRKPNAMAYWKKFVNLTPIPTRPMHAHAPIESRASEVHISKSFSFRRTNIQLRLRPKLPKWHLHKNAIQTLEKLRILLCKAMNQKF